MSFTGRIKAVFNAAFKYNQTQYAQLFLQGNEHRLMIDGPGANPYARSNPLFSVVSLIVESASQVPLVISDGEDREIESGPLWELMQSPQEDVDQATWVEQSIGHLVLSGRVHLFKLDSTGRRPGQLYPISGKQMEPVYAKSAVLPELLGWKFKPHGTQDTIPIPLDEVITISTFNPVDPNTGTSPVAVSDLDISQHWQADVFNRNALANGAEPGGLLTTDQRLKDGQAQEILEKWNSRHSGARKSRRVAVVEGGLKWQQVASTYQDMQFAELRNQSLRAIARAYKVPMPMLSDDATSTYANYETAERVFWQVTIARPMFRLCCSLTSNLVPLYIQPRERSRPVKSIARKWPTEVRRRTPQTRQGVVIWPDMETIPAFQAMRWERTKQLKELINSGVPLETASDTLDLGIDTSAMPWAREAFMPASMTTAAAILEDSLMEPPAPEGTPIMPEDDDDADGAANDPVQESHPTFAPVRKISSREQIRIWRSWVRSWEPLAKIARARIRRWFLQLAKVIQRNLPQIERLPKGKAPSEQDIRRLVFNLREESDKLAKSMRGVYIEGALLGASQVARELNLSSELTSDLIDEIPSDPSIAEFAAQQRPKLVSVAETTRRLVARTIANSLDEGLNMAQTAKAVRETMKATQIRSIMIARTETAQVLSRSRQTAMRKAGVSGKSWITAGDANVRDTHVQAGSDYATPIPVRDKFVVGGATLDQPSDPSGPPEEVINCRCVAIARQLESGRAIDPPKPFLEYQKGGNYVLS